MRRKTVLVTAVAIGVLVLTTCGRSGPHDTAITDLALAVSDVEGWAPAGEALVFEGDDLFELINGGAEIYHEFGFQRALSQDSTGPEGRVIALEVFEMQDPAAAYGAYAFKISGAGRRLELADEAMLEDYYLNFRGDRYVVTLTGMNDDEVTMQGLVHIAGAVAEKIQGRGAVPTVVANLMTDGRNPERTYYLRGELALADLAPFAVGMRLDMTEGAAARFSDHTELVLRYGDADRARQQYAAVVAELGARSGWRLVDAQDGESAVLVDAEGRQVRLAPAGESIVMVVADESVNTDDTIDQLVSRTRSPAAAGER